MLNCLCYGRIEGFYGTQLSEAHALINILS